MCLKLKHFYFQTKNVITVDGNKVTQVQKVGDGKTITFVREYSPDKLVVVSLNYLFERAKVKYLISKFALNQSLTTSNLPIFSSIRTSY